MITTKMLYSNICMFLFHFLFTIYLLLYYYLEMYKNLRVSHYEKYRIKCKINKLIAGCA